MNTFSAVAATQATQATSTVARASSLALAAFMTLVMLGSVNTLATRDAAAPQMAKAVSMSHA